jgi:hypothetical protein
MPNTDIVPKINRKTQVKTKNTPEGVFFYRLKIYKCKLPLMHPCDQLGISYKFLIFINKKNTHFWVFYTHEENSTG